MCFKEIDHVLSPDMPGKKCMEKLEECTLSVRNNSYKNQIKGKKCIFFHNLRKSFLVVKCYFAGMFNSYL